MRRRSTSRFGLTAFILLTLGAPSLARAAASTAAVAGTASITQDPSTGTWTLSSAGTSLTLTLDPGRDFAITRLFTTTGSMAATPWIRNAMADSTIQVGNAAYTLGARGDGFILRSVAIDQADTRLQLNATFELPDIGLRVVRHYAIADGSPSFEAWSTYSALNGPLQIANLNAIQMTLASGPVRTLTGLRGDNADNDSSHAFALQQTAVTADSTLAIGAQGRASETWVPWMAVDGAHDEFYLALMWSGAWSLTGSPVGPNLSVTAGLQPMTTTLLASVDGPHVVFGAVVGGLPDATAALASYIVNGLRGGRALSPLVTYNTWFAYGTDIDAVSMMAEMDNAAALGTELFVIDAGWYTGAGAGGPFDFDTGLGGWTPDPTRFPNGLRPLRDHAHALGMKFGIWVEPERVNLSLVGEYGLDETWLATNGGNYGSDETALICLSSTAARQWLFTNLTQLIDTVQPDYLKWDNNMWVNCDRDGHEHGKTDGNFAQVNGLYSMLASLRTQYPDLMIENVSGGGSRLDFGMLRYTDTAWMDDRTAPSVHVRHNIEGLGAIFPPAYLLSFVTDHDTESLHSPVDMSLYFRSRMAGILGLCFKTADYTDAEIAQMSHEIDIYRSARDTIAGGSAALLSLQAQDANGPAWDVLQTTAKATNHALVYAFQSDDTVDTINVKPVDLDPGTTYVVQSVETGVLGTATGADLMSRGIDIVQSPNTAAHLLFIKARD